MTAYDVELVRTSGISDAERRDRLGRVYAFLLSLGNRTADRDAVGSQQTRTAASTPNPSQGRDAQTHDTLNRGLAQVVGGGR